MGPKKKLTKKEKARLEAEQAEVLKIEVEKEKQRKLEEERERKQKEREQAEKRQQREITDNRFRRQQLKESEAYFGKIKLIIDGIKKEGNIRKEVSQQLIALLHSFFLLTEELYSIKWEHYMRCDGLPDVKIPGELRKYIHVWITSIIARNKNERNWLLQTNERTLLTQDKDIPNLSKDFLRKEQTNFGDIYSQRIQEVLGILVELDNCLDSETLSPETIADLTGLKFEFRGFLSEFLDDFTYKILSHVERDMGFIKPGVSHHEYESDIFKSEILAILGDSLTKQKEKFRDENRNTEIEFSLLKLQLSFPPTVKVANTALRGLWLNYDHFSDYCRSSRMPKGDFLHLSILQHAKKEWKKRKEILNSTLDETTKDTSVENFDGETTQSRVIDVDKTYAEYEDELNRARRKAMGPDGLNLAEFDVNLRKYRIVSGVYAIDLLEYPQQDRRLSAASFIKTVITPSGLTRRSFYHPYKTPPPPPPGVRRLPEEIEAEMKMIESNLEKLTQVTLQLPNTVLWFEPPIVCRWETPEESEELENNSVKSKNQHILEKQTSEAERRSSSRLDDLPVKEVIDFDLCNIPNNLDLLGLMKDFVVPRLPDGYCIRLEYKKSEKKKIIFHYLSRNFNVEDGLVKNVNKSKLQAAPIIDNLIESNSPRPFDAATIFKKILKIRHAPSVKRRSSCFDPIDVDDSVCGKRKSYMFSELIEDLDEIYVMQTNVFDQRIDEISSNLSSSLSPSLLETDSRRYSSVIIVREEEIPQKDDIDKEEEDEESGSEYDDPIGDDGKDTENETGSQSSLGKWSTSDVHDSKFNEDKFTIQFRTGRLGIFGFASNRYSNMPYQTWEVKPDIKQPGAIFYSLTAAVICIEIIVTNEGYCITSFQGGSTDTLSQMIGKTTSLEEMKITLRSCSIDIFPEEDAFCYTEGSCEKNYVMEMHLYNCISTLALSHNFSWSRWNLLSGSRTIVLLMREFIDGKAIPDHSTLLVTPLKTLVVDCTEVSTSFSTSGIHGMEFYADLNQLALAHIHPSNQEKRTFMDPVLRENVAQILMSTRPLSFC